MVDLDALQAIVAVTQTGKPRCARHNSVARCVGSSGIDALASRGTTAVRRCVPESLAADAGDFYGRRQLTYVLEGKRHFVDGRGHGNVVRQTCWESIPQRGIVANGIR